MKNRYFVSVFFITLFIPLLIFGQKKGSSNSTTPVSVLSNDDILFRKGTTIFDLLPNITYTSMKDDATNPNTSSSFNTDIRGNFFAWDNIGLIAGIHSNSYNAYTDRVRNIQNDFSFEAGGIYGTYLGNIPISAEASLSVGSYKSRWENDDPFFEDTELKASSFSYNIKLSSYFKLDNTEAYIQPYLGFGSLNRNYKKEEFKTTNGGLYFGVTIVKPMTLDEFYSGCGDRVQPDRYAKGSNYLQFKQNGLLEFGSNVFKTENDKIKDGVFGYSLQLTDYYYIANNFAVGAGLEVVGSSRKAKESDIQFSGSDLYFKPMTRYHLPVENNLNNLFADGGLIFGTMSERDVDITGVETITKSTTFGWEIGAGYNYPFSDHFSATATLHYVNQTNTGKDNGVKTKERGLKFMSGISYRF